MWQGIDTSHWDGPVDFSAWWGLRDMSFAIVKAGGNEGGRYCDSMWESNYAAARDAGLHVGSYYYTTSTDCDSARADAEHFASLLEGKSLDMPCYMDVENSRQFELSRRELTDVIRAFCDRLQELGYKAGIYTGGYAWLWSMYPAELICYADWIAWWRERWPDECGDVGMHQVGSIRLSDGHVAYDDVDGHTDFDRCRIAYWQGGGGGARTTGLTIAERIAQVAEHIANHDAHGYSQPNRAGDGTVEDVTLSDGSVVRIHGGDYDCSEDARMCAAAAGALPWDYWESYMWTGNEYDALTSHGFVCTDFDRGDVRRGDILLMSGHTGVALGNGLQADAHGDEYGGIDGPNQGDQTGHEIEVRDLGWGWTHTFRYVGPEPYVIPLPEEPVMPQQPGDAHNGAGLRYRAHVQTFGWLPAVRDGQVAGTTGYSKRMEALQIAPPDGWVLYVKAHMQDIGWVTYDGIAGGELDDAKIIGTVGESRRIECIIVGVSSRPVGDTRHLEFRVHQQDVGWKAWTAEGYASGTDGMSIRLEAVQMRLVG